MGEEAEQHGDALDTEREMREHEREARERSEDERTSEDAGAGEGDRDESLGTPDSDAMPAPPGNVQGGNLGGAS